MDKLKEIDKLIVQQQQILELQKQLKEREYQLSFVADILTEYFAKNYNVKEGYYKVEDVNNYVGALLSIISNFENNKNRFDEILKNIELWSKIPRAMCK